MITGVLFLIVSVVLHILIPSQIRTLETSAVTAATVPTLLIRGMILCTGNRIEPPFSRTEIQQNAIGKQQRGNDESDMRKQQRVCDQHGNIDYRFQPQQIFSGENGS